MPSVVRDQPFPSATIMDPVFVTKADYTDSYSATLSKCDLTPAELFHAVFGHRPAWIKAAMLSRNWVASMAGLEAATPREILNPPRQSDYCVGGKIGAWPVYAISNNELIAGRDNKHMDFRLSVLRVDLGHAWEARFSTACMVNNSFGKVYLRSVLPFHKLGLRHLIASAVAAGRL